MDNRRSMQPIYAWDVGGSSMQHRLHTNIPDRWKPKQALKIRGLIPPFEDSYTILVSVSSVSAPCITWCRKIPNVFFLLNQGYVFEHRNPNAISGSRQWELNLISSVMIPCPCVVILPSLSLVTAFFTALWDGQRLLALISSVSWQTVAAAW